MTVKSFFFLGFQWISLSHCIFYLAYLEMFICDLFLYPLFFFPPSVSFFTLPVLSIPPSCHLLCLSLPLHHLLYLSLPYTTCCISLSPPTPIVSLSLSPYTYCISLSSLHYLLYLSLSLLPPITSLSLSYTTYSFSLSLSSHYLPLTLSLFPLSTSYSVSPTIHLSLSLSLSTIHLSLAIIHLFLTKHHPSIHHSPSYPPPYLWSMVKCCLPWYTGSIPDQLYLFTALLYTNILMFHYCTHAKTSFRKEQ